MLPDRAIPARVADGAIVPAFLAAADLPWLEALLIEAERFRGRPLRELNARLRAPLPSSAPATKAQAALEQIRHSWRATVQAALPPPSARAELFAEATRRPGEARAQILAAVAQRLALTAGDLDRALFADLPGERIVVGPPSPIGAEELRLRTNALIARSLLARATTVRVETGGAIEPLARRARRWGLLFCVRDGGLVLSGPFALFRRTLLYGRAMAALVAVLPESGRFVLSADCVLAGEPGRLRLDERAPIFPFAAAAPDRALHERFVRDFAAPDWTLGCDPPPVRAGDELLYADFVLTRGERRVFVELLGFWTPDHVAAQFARARAAGAEWLFCLDETRRCADGELPGGARIVHYSRSVDLREVLAAVEEAQ